MEKYIPIWLHNLKVTIVFFDAGNEKSGNEATDMLPAISFRTNG